MSADLAERETDLGKLMHDLRCPDPERMHYKALRERARYLKRSEEGIGEMTGEFDRILRERMKKIRESSLKEGRENGIKESARNNAMTMIADGSLPISKVAKFSGLSIGEVEEIRKGIEA